MTSVLSRALPPPNNWQDFESLCFDLYARLWKTNDIEMHGRRGQPQAGVDVYGTDRVEGKFVGVQCKGKDEGYGAVLTKAELRDEVEKAKTFKPPIDIFIVATTAMNDAAAQQLARDISKEHTKQGLFEVRVQGWLTLKQRITDSRELVAKHFPDFAPYDLVQRFDAGVAVAEREGDQTRTLIVQQNAKILTVLTERLDGADPLQLKINEAIKLVEDGSPRTALRVYERLWREAATTASKRNRYRLKANIGVANLLLGNKEVAIQEFRAAYAEDPKWPGARAVLSMALQLEGKLREAFDLACQVLAEDATARQAIAVIVDTAPDEYSAADLKALIPEELRTEVNTLLGLSMRAHRQRDYTSAESYARQALDILPDDWRTLSTLAAALLGPIAEIEGVLLTRNIPLELQPRFDQALGMFRQAWAILETRDDAIRGDHVAANLISCLDIAGVSDEATLVLGRALHVAPDYSPLLRRYARSMVEADDWPAAAKAIVSIPEHLLEPADRLVRLQALVRMGDAARARDEARSLQSASDDQRLVEMAGAMRLEAASSLGVLKEELDDLLKDWPNSIMLRSVAIGLLPDGDSRIVALAGEVDQLVSGIDNPRDRLHAAEALYRAKAFSQAADLYDGLHGTSQDALTLRRRLQALYFADRRADARKLFDSLTEDLKTQYAELGAAIYERSGLIPQAKHLLEVRLANTENLANRLQWIALVERLGDSAAVTKWLKTVSPEQQGRPDDLMMLALAIDRHLGGTGSLPIAYRALRGGFSDPQIHLAYTIQLFLMGNVGRGVMETPNIVAPDVAVTLTEKDGDKRLTRIIETEPDPRVERDEIAPGHALAQRLLGLQRGDKIELENVGFEPTCYIVTEIQSKYLYAHFRSLQRFEAMFPDNRVFGSFNVNEAQGEERFKSIFDGAKRRHEFTEKLIETYRSGSVPLALLAKFVGTSPLAVWESIRYHPAVEFHTAFGVTPEFAEADSTLATNRCAVVDAITLYGLVRLGIADRLKAVFEDLGVVRTTLDLLRAYVEEWRAKRGTQQGSFGWDGEHYRMMELTNEMIEQHVADAQAALDFAEALTLIPAETRAGIKDEARDAFENVHPAFLDSILAAQGDGRVLLCDDRPLRCLAAEAAGVPSVWSQAAAKFAMEKRLITSESYFEVTGALAEASYAFTIIGHLDFLYELNKTAWVVSPRAEKFIELLANPSSEQGSVRNVLSGLIFSGWRDAPSKDAYQTVFAKLFRSLKKAQPGIVVAKLAQDVFEQAMTALRTAVRKRYFMERLKRSTYLTPVGVVVQSIDRLADPTGSRVAGVISEAITGLD